jgi:RNA polymerase sigma-70 factor (ECF subfamily)
MSDLEFVQRCIKADKLAWDEFVDKYSRLIYNYIHSVLKIKGFILTEENIADLFQDILFSLVKDNFKKLGSFKGKNGCSLASWLRQVVINSTIDHIRKSRAVTDSLDEENNDGLNLKDILRDDSIPVSDSLIQEEKLARLKGCIEELDNDDKYFLELHINRELGPDEMKRLLGISRGAIDMRKFRIISRLKECFKSKGFKLDF